MRCNLILKFHKKIQLLYLWVLLLSVLFSTTLLAESTIPRLPDGKPDFNGVWQVLNTANYDIEPHAARAALQMREGPLGKVPAKEIVSLGTVASVPAGKGVVVDDVIPYREWALKKREENRENYLQLDPEIKCYLPGVPRATYMPFPFQIVQSDKNFFIAYEYAGATRNIFLKDPGEAPIDSWMGQSYGKWDGDTFITEVTGQNDQTWFDRAGNFHSADMIVTEKYTLLSKNLMRYEAIIDDEKVFTEPWAMSMNLYRRQNEDAQLLQFKCIEFVEELLYGHLRRSK